MIVPLAVVAAAVAVVVAGGHLGALADVRFRLPALAVVAVVAQVVLFEVVDEHLSAGVAAALHVLTYVPASVFVLANRALPGLALVVAGAGLNVLAIAANGGVMPSTAWARDVADVADQGDVRNSGEVADARLLPLGDVLAVPGPAPVGSVFSVGDVLIVGGGGAFLWCTCRPARGGTGGPAEAERRASARTRR